MMDLIERIGPFLGIAAFLGFALLVLLYFQQARDVRRLREWAGKAPERALAATEARGEEPPELEHGRLMGSLISFGTRLHEGFTATWAWFGARFRAIDRHSPVDLRVIVVILALGGIVAAGATTDGFGFLADERETAGGRDEPRRAPPPGRTTVSVLNGTAASGVAVPGLASEIAEFVEDDGYRLDEVTDTDTSFLETVAMFAPGERRAARRLARDLDDELEGIEVQPMTAEVSDLAGGADVALVLGQDAAELRGIDEPEAPPQEPAPTQQPPAETFEAPPVEPAPTP